ncbi:hypothetical protein D9M68_667890 [compost metagenome]
MIDPIRDQARHWLWTLRYRLAALSQPARLLLLGCLLLQALLMSGLVAYEQRAAELQRSFLHGSSTDLLADRPADAGMQDLLERFRAFLPDADEAERIGAALHKAADEAGIAIDKLGSQPEAGQYSAFQRHTLHLQLKGARDKVERFILLALLDNDSLLLRRWAFQTNATDASAASSTLDFELLVGQP